MKIILYFFRLKRVRQTHGFSTIIALLLTGFLVTLAAGILFLFLSENRINQSLFSGTAAYHASEGALEYALLKIKNHREGFSDNLLLTSSDGELLINNTAREAKMGYDIIATGTSYSGAIAPESFDIIPLFYENGKVLNIENGKPWKDPRNPMKNITPTAFDDRISTSDFELRILSGDRIVWNVIGNGASGQTFGISGIVHTTLPDTLPQGVPVQEGSITGTTLGIFRKYDGGVASETTKSIELFLGSYVENYLVLYNPSVSYVKYSIASKDATPFTFPKTQITASGKVGNSIINLQMSEDKSRLYDILKYSLFVPE
jgi:hypothetical protein